MDCRVFLCVFFPLDISLLPTWHYSFKGHFSAVTGLPKEEETKEETKNMGTGEKKQIIFVSFLSNIFLLITACRKGFSSHRFLKDVKNLLLMYLIVKVEDKNAEI